MKRFGLGTLVLGTVVASPAPSLARQLQGHPVYVSTSSRGVDLAVDFGRGVNDESGRNTGLAIRAGYAFSRVRVGIGVGVLNPIVSALGPVRETEIEYMAHGSLTVVRTPTLPVTLALHAGVGILNVETIGSEQVLVPIGLLVAAPIQAGGWELEPWLTPRLIYRRIGFGALGPVTQSGVGLGAGVNARLGGRWELHGGIERSSFGEARSETFSALETEWWVVGFGARLAVGGSD